MPIALFELGRVVASSIAMESLTHEEMTAALRRHKAGDWGDLTDEDKAENNTALMEGRRIMSLYSTPDGQQFWILTEANRSTTTIFLPEEY